MKMRNNQPIRKYYNYILAILILIIALIYPNSLLRKGSFEFFYNREIVCDILKYAVFASILGCYSGYTTKSKKHDFDFCITYPIFEEILFRGVIFMILVNSQLISNKFGMEIFSMIFSALLFGIMHFQYFGFKMSSVRYVILAFIGGYVFSYLVLRTQSILPTMFLHMIFNTSAILFTKHKNRKAADKMH